MASSLGATKAVILVSAGLAGSVLIQNNKLGEFIGDLTKVFSKHLRERDDTGSGSSSSDAALSAQVKRLAQELRYLASSSRTVTVVQGGEASGSGFSYITVILPAALAGYGYMKWKGLSFSSIMYVTKKGLNTAVEQMGKQLDHVSGALSSTRKHMNQRLDSVNLKLDEGILVTGLIKDEVEQVKREVGRSIFEIENVNVKMEGLGMKIDEIQQSQSFANQGIFLLIEWVHRQFPNQQPELAANFNAWYLKASSLDKGAAFPGLVASPGLKQLFFSEPLEVAPVRNLGESRPPGLNMPSPGLLLTGNSTPSLPRSGNSGSILYRANLWGNSGLAGIS